MWDFHDSEKYPCTQKISPLAQKLTILGLKNFMGKMMILGTPFQPLCTVHKMHCIPFQSHGLEVSLVLNRIYMNCKKQIPTLPMHLLWKWFFKGKLNLKKRLIKKVPFYSDASGCRIKPIKNSGFLSYWKLCNVSVCLNCFW